jgi:uncharacterized protein YwgA
MNSETPNFLAFLHHNQLVDVLSIPHDDDDNGFINRLKLQKLVYFAQKRFNLPTNYSYTLYKNGIYSPDLTDDYYNIDIYDLENFNPNDYTEYCLPAEFNQDRFLSIFLEKSPSWLEVGSTILYFIDQRILPVKEKIIDQVKNKKPQYSSEYILKVYEELHREKLILNTDDEISRIHKRSPDLFEALAKEDPTLITNL